MCGTERPLQCDLTSWIAESADIMNIAKRPTMGGASGSTGFLGRGGSGSGNSNMRGLVQFIADLRNARARELEEKRINKELANIRYAQMRHKSTWGSETDIFRAS